MYKRNNDTFSVNLVGAASESVGEFVNRKKEAISPVIQTVGEIKNTLADTPLIKTVARNKIVLPELIGKSADVVTDMIKVIKKTSCNCLVNSYLQLKLSLLKAFADIFLSHKESKVK